MRAVTSYSMGMMNVTNSNGRAIKGGQIGMNGERYEGGQFLPNTELTKIARTAKKPSSRKEQIGMYEWAVAPEGKHSLYTQFCHLIRWETQTVGQINAQGVAYYRRTIEEVQGLYNRWLAGERWV